jgi:tetratricopeptide (TPR) repeat protein
MYLPAMALTVLVISLAAWGLKRRPKTAFLILVGVVTGLCALTVARNREYRSALTMWQVTVERWPQGRARLNYAASLQAVGRRDEMLAQLNAAVDDYPEARFDLGAQLASVGDLERGLQELEAFVREFPTHPNAVAARDLIARTRGQLAAQATDRGIAHAAAYRTGDAVREFRRAADLLPDNANVHRNLANALLDARDYGGAAAEARFALRLNPTDAAAKEILAAASRER